MLPILWFAGAAALLWTVRRSTPSVQAPLGPVTLYAGVPYRMAIRSETGSGSAATVAAVQKTIRNRLLGTAGAGSPTFSFSDTRPAWAEPGATHWGRLITTFQLVPARTQETARGSTIEGIGVVDWILRLDGKPFEATP